ncbi:MAG: LysE family translocator [Segetibacter sp.]|nr:LysE family translocator [Segetibacter sp.]
MTYHSFWIFAFASLIINITPGNDMLYVISRSAGQGSKAGIISAFGITCGCLVHLLAAVIGLSALIAQSALAFNLIKYIGAIYLIFLGVKAFVNKTHFECKQLESSDYKTIFVQGVVTNIFNPKVALFFLAFLPQFIDVTNPHPQLQILALGAWFNFSGTVVNVLVALLFGRVGNWFGNSAFIKWQPKITGTILIALGIKVALTKP